MNTSMKLNIVVLLTLILFLAPIGVLAQNEGSRQIKIMHKFVHDLQSGKPNGEIFKEYLSSRGIFTNDTVRQVANGGTDLIRESLVTVKATEVEIYKYTDRPETGRKLKRIEDPDPNEIEQLPLEFTLDAPPRRRLPVDVSDIYILRIPQEGNIFFLFGKDGKMLSYFSMLWGHRRVFVGF